MNNISTAILDTPYVLSAQCLFIFSQCWTDRRGQFDMPRYQLTAYGGRSFVCAAVAWNSLPDSLKDTAMSLSCFQYYTLRHFFSLVTNIFSTLEVTRHAALYKIYTLHIIVACMWPVGTGLHDTVVSVRPEHVPKLQRWLERSSLASRSSTANS